MHVDAMQGRRPVRLNTTFTPTSATNEIIQDPATSTKTDQISPRAVVAPNGFLGSYEALAARLSASSAGAELPIYVPPQAEVKLTVNTVTNEVLQTPWGSMATRRYDVTFHNIGADVSATVLVDSRARLARMDIPAAGLSVVRTDLAGVNVRTSVARNKTDTDVSIPANGFMLAGTITMPPATGRTRHPAVVLVAGSGAVDRDETVAGIPIFVQLADALAARGFLVLRYDKRGVGQSGGREESVTLQDYADDLSAAVKWLSKRKDVDRKAIAVVGHSEGGAVALIAAAHDDRIASLVLVAAPGNTGAELILEQQRHLLDTMKISAEEREAKITLQKKIQAAVMTDKGWEEVPPNLRKQVDTPWFRSLLLFDPAAVMKKVDQPILIIQGDLDRQVAAPNADRLAELARARKKKTDVRVEHLPGINHLLVRAETGEVAEYGALKEKTIAPQVAGLIADWLQRKQTSTRLQQP
jgi:pimeloyl-ACP methyl ester carboxylesterase